MPSISVIVPVYRVEPYLRRCIDSILLQSYKDFELILVDDGSPDNCPRICDEYALKDNRIVVIHKENGGLSSARNVGLDNATGDYISFIDSDDWVDPFFLEILANDIKGCDISCCDCFIVYDNQLQKNGTKSGKRIIVDSIDYYNTFLPAFVKSVAWAKLYKRHVFNIIRYPVAKTNEDEYVIHHVIGVDKKISVRNKPLYYYCTDNPTSISKKLTKNEIRINKLEICADRSIYYYNNKIYDMFLRYFHFSILLLIRLRVKPDKRTIKSYGTIKTLYNEAKVEPGRIKTRDYYLFLLLKILYSSKFKRCK